MEQIPRTSRYLPILVQQMSLNKTIKRKYSSRFNVHAGVLPNLSLPTSVSMLSRVTITISSLVLSSLSIAMMTMCCHLQSVEEKVLKPTWFYSSLPALIAWKQPLERCNAFFAKHLTPKIPKRFAAMSRTNGSDALKFSFLLSVSQFLFAP